MRLPTLRPPPVLAIGAVLAAGLFGPFLVDAAPRPAELSLALARDRLAGFRGVAREVAPAGEILGERPAFEWRGVRGAARYTLAITTPEGRVWRTADSTTATYFLLPPPSRIEPGQSLRFTVRALDAAGNAVGEEQAAAFSRAAPDEALAALARAARAALRGPAAHLVLAGLYAERGSSDDVASELRAYLEGAPGTADAPLAREVLARLGRTVPGD